MSRNDLFFMLACAIAIAVMTNGPMPSTRTASIMLAGLTSGDPPSATSAAR